MPTEATRNRSPSELPRTRTIPLASTQEKRASLRQVTVQQLVRIVRKLRPARLTIDQDSSPVPRAVPQPAPPCRSSGKVKAQPEGPSSGKLTETTDLPERATLRPCSHYTTPVSLTTRHPAQRHMSTKNRHTCANSLLPAGGETTPNPPNWCTTSGRFASISPATFT